MSPAILPALTLIIILLIYLIIQNKSIMAKQDKFNEMLARLDEATNEIAKDITALRDEVKGTISDDALAKFDAQISRLEEMGKDPENPIPETEETPQG